MKNSRVRVVRRARSGRRATLSPWYQLKIALEGTDPAVWRRLAVRGDLKLDLLHAVLQIAMGWTNSHLHLFLIGADQFSDPSLVGDLGMGDEDQDERKVTLAQIVSGGVNTFGYEYDFGDSWTHVLTVEKELPPEAKSKVFARCLDGGRACPPEDCGGTYGFAELLKVMKNPRHPEYKSMVRWLGRPFDPEAFDLAETNRFLGMLQWPRTSVRSLASVLYLRDCARARRGKRSRARKN